MVEIGLSHGLIVRGIEDADGAPFPEEAEGGSDIVAVDLVQPATAIWADVRLT